MSSDPNYQYQPVMQPVPQTMMRDSGSAIASLVMGIMAWTFLPILGALVAIICGHIGVAEVKKGNGYVKGKGMAVAGLVMGYVQIGLIILFVVGMLVLAPVISDTYSNIYSGMY
jgi:hypothetical protein